MITRLPTERVNYWTHFAGLVAWIPVTLLLVAVASGLLTLSPYFLPTGWNWSLEHAHWDLVAIALVYGFGVMFLFFSSSTYHKFKQAENEKSFWRTLDHFAIFVMIAASYTPIVWIWFDPAWRLPTLAFQWAVTLAGLLFKIFLPKAPRWIDPVLYLLMGWVAVVDLVPLYQNMPFPVFFDMLWGGVWFSVGAVIYAVKKPNFRPGFFGFHELFHVFILGGAATHCSMVLRSMIAAVATYSSS
jgi:hemolysin III